MSQTLPTIDMERRTGDFINELMVDCLNNPDRVTGFTLTGVLPDGHKSAVIKIAAELVYDVEADALA